MAKDQPTLPCAIFSVRTTDNKFDSSLSIPIGSSPEQYQPVVEAWLRLMHAALTSHRDYSPSFAPAPAPPSEGKINP